MSCWNPISFVKGKYNLKHSKISESHEPRGKITVFQQNQAYQNGNVSNTVKTQDISIIYNNEDSTNKEQITENKNTNQNNNKLYERHNSQNKEENTVTFQENKTYIRQNKDKKQTEEKTVRRATAYIPHVNVDSCDSDDDQETTQPVVFKKVSRESVAKIHFSDNERSHLENLANDVPPNRSSEERVSFETRDPKEFIQDKKRNSFINIAKEEENLNRMSQESVKYDYRKKHDSLTLPKTSFESQDAELTDPEKNDMVKTSITDSSQKSSLVESNKSEPEDMNSSPASSISKKELSVSDFVQRGEADDSDSSSVRPNRKAGVLAAPVDDEENIDDITLEYVEKDYRTRELIEKAILANDFLKNIMYDERLERVISAMTSKHYDADSFVINEGEIGSHLYVSDTGNFEVIKDGKVVKTFGPGVAFGELAILYKARRFASIKVTTSSTVWTLERTMYSKIMIGTRRQEQEENVRFLYSVPLFQDVHPVEINRICDILKREFYQTGTAIVRQGDPGDKFYIIRGGSVEVTRRETDLEADAPAGTLSRGDYFGEQALIHESVRLATVTALPPGTECLTLDRTAFIELLGNIKDLKEKTYPGASSTTSVYSNKIENKDYAHIHLNELEIVGTLGVGGFGRVELVRHASDLQKTFALKCLQKVDIVQQQQQQHVYNEKHVMASCDSPFICRLYNTYKDSKYLYFLMEACLGGDVWTALHKAKCFDEKTARFVTACVIEAFEYLHNKNMIFRDLKPENLMLDYKGYIKLVDFGFAKRVELGKKAWTFAGTPEYVAPEVIQNRGHDRAVDYWAIGILIHELLVGKPPFRGSDNMKTYHQILKGIDHVQMPGKVARKAQELIRKLCRPAPAERLGYQKNGLQDVKNHPWYTSVAFDWASLQSQEMPAPLIRPVESSTDMRNFDKFPKNREFPPDEFSGFDINF